MDLCGPLHTKSLNGARYFLLFVDDYNRFCSVYFLKNKSEVFEEFVRFKAAVERETGCKLKLIRSDNGGDIMSQILEEHLKKEGNKHQLTVPYTPRQNGVSEGRN